MNVSSSEVIDSVAAEIKHYLETQKREDQFDLSGPNQPRRAYPKLKVGSTVNYGRMHDRSLKHYFTPSMIRTQIANLEAVPPGSPRQRSVKRRLTKKIRQLAEDNTFNEPLVTQQVNDELYTAQMQALSMLHAETQQKLKKKVFYGPPLLRRSTPPKLTRGAAWRLVNRSSQILVATKAYELFKANSALQETVALAHEILAQRHHVTSRPQSAPANWSNGLPGIYYSPDRPKTARGRSGLQDLRSSTPNSFKKKPKYVWDINGRRIRNRSHDEFDDLSSISYSSSSSSVETEMHPKAPGRRYKPTRPTSAMALPHRMHVNNFPRPYSAGHVDPTERHAAHTKTPRQAVSPDNGFCVDAKTQTRYRRKPTTLVKQAFRSGSESDRDSRFCKYEVEIGTGDRLGAGTSADIYLSLHGDEGETDEIYLSDPVSTDKKHKPFKRGQTDVFRIEAEKVGNLKKIGVGHDQKGKGFSWFLSHVIVRDNKNLWKFHCKTWLSGTFSKKKTFRHFSLDHESSESSEASSESSSTESESTKTMSQKSLRRLPSSSSSSVASSRSSASLRRKASSGSEKDQVHSPPLFTVQPPTPVSSGHTFEIGTSSGSASQSSKSALEYSSDSSSDGQGSAKISESFVEESEDTRARLSSSSTSTLTDFGENATTSGGNQKSSKFAPFSIDSFFDEKTSSQRDVSSSDDSKSSVSSVKKKNEDKSSSDSLSNDESTPRNEIQGAKPRPVLKKQFSEVIALSAVESADQLSSPALATAKMSTVSDEPVEVSQVKDHQLIEAEEQKSNKSSSDSDTESSASSIDSSVVNEEILAESSDEKHSLVEEKTFSATGFDLKKEVKQVAEEEPREVVEVSHSFNVETSNKSNTSSSSTSSDQEEPLNTNHETNDIVQSSVNIYDNVTNNIVQSFVNIDDDVTNDIVQSSVNVDDDVTNSIAQSGANINEHLIENDTVTDEDANLAKDDVSDDRFNTKRLSLTAQILLENQKSKLFEIEESLQSDEEGIVQPPSLPSIRGDVHNLIKEGETDKVMEILILRPELKEKANEKGWTPLHMASNHGKLEIVQWLAGSGANLKAETPTGYTAMHMAAMHGHVECVKVLYAMGADVDALNVDGQTPLHLACMSDQLETATWLAENGADLHIRDTFGRTALDLSKQYHHHDVTKFLKNHLRTTTNKSNVTSELQSSRSSLGSMKEASDSSSSSSSEEELEENNENAEDASRDIVAEDLQSKELEEKKRLYQKQQLMMKRRRSSFLDMIRAETEENPKQSSHSSSDSEAEGRHQKSSSSESDYALDEDRK